MTPRTGRPHFSNFGPPAERRPFCKKVFGHREKAWFSRFGRPRGAVGHFSRFGAHLPLGLFSRFDPKVPHFSRKYPSVTPTRRGSTCRSTASRRGPVSCAVTTPDRAELRAAHGAAFFVCHVASPYFQRPRVGCIAAACRRHATSVLPSGRGRSLVVVFPREVRRTLPSSNALCWQRANFRGIRLKRCVGVPLALDCATVVGWATLSEPASSPSLS